MPEHTKLEQPADADSDNVWGCDAIGKELGDRTAGQVRYLIGKGVLKDAVKKVGHRTYVGSRRKLRGFSQAI
jgi:hypothetical protein